MADIAELGFRVDSTSVGKAALELEKLEPAANKAERATDKFNGVAGRSKSVVASMAAGIGGVASSVGRFAAGLPGINGLIAIFSRELNGARTSVDGLQAQVNRFNAGGIAAQFQDVGVTAAMGMNPLVIALQQGTQLSGQLSTMSGSLWANLRAGLLSVVSPLSLTVIGFIALLAAGIQFVQWGKVTETVLNAIADKLEAVAPYAAGAAVALALLYSPAILAGISTVTVAIYGLVQSVVIAAATMALANPGAALILGLVAAATAVVIFRDEIAKVFGRDIVQDAQNGLNIVIGVFIGSFNAIVAVFSRLPAVFGEIMWGVGNAILGAIEKIVKDTASEINKLINLIPEQFRGGMGEIDVGAINFTAGWENPNAGALADVTAAYQDAVRSAQGVDYVGKGIEVVQHAASGAADALRGMATAAGLSGTEADKAGKKAADAAAKAAEAYRNVTDSAHEFIAAQQLEASVLGMTAVQANTLRYQQDLLNQATQNGAVVSAAQRQELMALGQSMAEAEQHTASLTETYQFGQQTFSNFLSSFRQDLMGGTSLWDSFANAAIGALDSIANRALEMAANGIWDMIFGGIMSGISGGLAPGGAGFLGGGASAWAGFASGGYTGNAGTGQPAGVVHGQEYVMNAQATRSIGLGALNAMNNTGETPSNDNGGFVYQDNRSYNLGDGSGISREELEELMAEDRRALLADMPNIIQNNRGDPRKRRVG